MKEEFIEFGFRRSSGAEDGLQRPASSCHQQHGQAFVFGNIGIGADTSSHQCAASITVPDFLSVDDVVIALNLGFAADVGQIRTGVGLGESLAPDFFQRSGFLPDGASSAPQCQRQ